jgi:RHS repeat-associated protein
MTAIGSVAGYSECTQEGLSVSANSNNQLVATGYSYDASGNMLTDGANTYTYNAESEIATAAGLTYLYDGDGNRVQKGTGTVYWYGGGSQILSQSFPATIGIDYIYFGGKRVAERRYDEPNVYYYEADMLGSSRTTVVAGQTSPFYDADFYPFGGERAVTDTGVIKFKFEGKERDTETGDDDFGARYYNSRIGRWLSSDWSSVPVPVPYANLTNPQTLNLYAMVSDNPESFADLDGHTPGDPYVGPPPWWLSNSGLLGEAAVGAVEGEPTTFIYEDYSNWEALFEALSLLTQQSGTPAAQPAPAQQQPAAVPLKDDKGNVVNGANGNPALVPANLNVKQVIDAGTNDVLNRALFPALGDVATTVDLAKFDRGGKWDLQRQSGNFDQRYVDSATILIGIYAASASISRNKILRIENFIARNAIYAKGTQMDRTYTHLPESNVENTDIGMRLVLSGAIKGN